VAYRIAAGVLGLLALGAWFVLRRRWTRQARSFALPAPVVDTLAVTAFGAAGLWTLGLALDWTVQGQHGAGGWWSAAPVALAAACWFGLRLVGDLRRPAAPAA